MRSKAISGAVQLVGVLGILASSTAVAGRYGGGGGFSAGRGGFSGARSFSSSPSYTYRSPTITSTPSRTASPIQSPSFGNAGRWGAGSTSVPMSPSPARSPIIGETKISPSPASTFRDSPKMSSPSPNVSSTKDVSTPRSKFTDFSKGLAVGTGLGAVTGAGAASAAHGLHSSGAESSGAASGMSSSSSGKSTTSSSQVSSPRSSSDVVTTIKPHSDSALAAKGYREQLTTGKTNAGESFKQSNTLDGAGKVVASRFETSKQGQKVVRDEQISSADGSKKISGQTVDKNGNLVHYTEKRDTNNQLISRDKVTKDSGGRTLASVVSQAKDGQIVQQTQVRNLASGGRVSTQYNFNASNGRHEWVTNLPGGQSRQTVKLKEGTTTSRLSDSQGRMISERKIYANGTRDITSADGSRIRYYADGNSEKWNSAGQRIYQTSRGPDGNYTRRYGPNEVHHYHHYYSPWGFHYPIFGWEYYPWYPTYWPWFWTPAPVAFPAPMWCGLFVCGPGFGSFFAPVYPGPIFWMTDWVIASMILERQSSERAAMMSQQNQSERLQQLIDESVKREVQAQVKDTMKEIQSKTSGSALSSAADAEPMGSIFQKSGKIFFVQRKMYVVDANENACVLNKGDLLKVLKTPDFSSVGSNQSQSVEGEDSTEPKDVGVQMVVYRSQKGPEACARNHVVKVDLDEVVEMDNEFKRAIENGIQQQNQQHRSERAAPVAP